jgi:hypothetical protein
MRNPSNLSGNYGRLRLQVHRQTYAGARFAPDVAQRNSRPSAVIDSAELRWKLYSPVRAAHVVGVLRSGVDSPTVAELAATRSDLSMST